MFFSSDFFEKFRHTELSITIVKLCQGPAPGDAFSHIVWAHLGASVICLSYRMSGAHQLQVVCTAQTESMLRVVSLWLILQHSNHKLLSLLILVVISDINFAEKDETHLPSHSKYFLRYWQYLQWLQSIDIILVRFGSVYFDWWIFYLAICWALNFVNNLLVSFAYVKVSSAPHRIDWTESYAYLDIYSICDVLEQYSPTAECLCWIGLDLCGFWSL